jgi:hypothetical protein
MTLEAYLQHGAWGGPYRTEKVPVKQTDTVPRKGSTVMGYGGNLPTSYMVKFNKRWHRVRCVCFSNSGTLWTKVDGVKTVVRIDHWS